MLEAAAEALFCIISDLNRLMFVLMIGVILESAGWLVLRFCCHSLLLLTHWLLVGVPVSNHNIGQFCLAFPTQQDPQQPC